MPTSSDATTLTSRKRTRASWLRTEAVDASLADVEGVVLVRDAVVDYDQITVAAGATKANVTAPLAAVGIIARTEPAETESL